MPGHPVAIRQNRTFEFRSAGCSFRMKGGGKHLVCHVDKYPSIVSGETLNYSNFIFVGGDGGDQGDISTWNKWTGRQTFPRWDAAACDGAIRGG